MKFFLSINQLTVAIKLGVPASERVLVQKVHFDIKIEQSQTAVMLKDDIQHLLDYDQLCKEIIKFTQEKEFLTIEYLCHQLFQHLKHIIPGSPRMNLKITKPKLPVPYQVDSAAFEIVEID